MSRDEGATLTMAVSDRDHAEGPDTAPITLVEYGDYECPYCGRAYPIIKKTQQHFGPQLRFVFRNFPLTRIHPHAQHAAEAAEAAAAQGHFWEMHDALFRHQGALSDGDLTVYAEEIGLDRTELLRDLADGTYEPRVREDFRSGVRSGVNGTPTFFINGSRYNGAWDFEVLMAALEAAMVASDPGGANE